MQINRYAADYMRSISPRRPDNLPVMNLAATNLFDAHSIVSSLGLIGVLGIIFMETGLLIDPQ